MVQGEPEIFFTRKSFKSILWANIPINAEFPILNHIVKYMLVQQICEVILHGQADFVNKIVHFDGVG